MDFENPKESDDPQVFEYSKGISIGSIDFENPKFYGNTCIFEGLVLKRQILSFRINNHNSFWRPLAEKLWIMNILDSLWILNIDEPNLWQLVEAHLDCTLDHLIWPSLLLSRVNLCLSDCGLYLLIDLSYNISRPFQSSCDSSADWPGPVCLELSVSKGDPSSSLPCKSLLVEKSYDTQLYNLYWSRFMAES